MLKKINGTSYKDMINYGLSNLIKHCATVNDLNVFPVPDGDTGTNMVMTMKNGLNSIKNSSDKLSQVAQSFANATVFGARGNSGVILSQFFKGMSEGFAGEDEADPHAFTKALDKGCEFAYASVGNPVEGTILTVIKDATEAVKESLPTLDTIDETVSLLVSEAKISLENTPELLPLLKKAGVVDSGGSGMVYFFEGMKKYLDGEEIDTTEESDTQGQYVDYSAFNKDSNFDFGYCTEVRLQLTVDECDFDYKDFVAKLHTLGDSIATSLEGDKVKVHIHTPFPEKALAFCHSFGEFLTMKIENMSVQHTQNTQKLLVAREMSEGAFAIVAVAPNSMLQKMLSDMGADVCILSDEAPSSNDFLEAFELISNKEILVFPNSSNSILSAMQAGTLYKKAKINVLNCRSIAECYSALAIIDFGSDDVNGVIEDVNDTLGNISLASIVRAEKNVTYGSRKIVKNDFFALHKNEIITSGNSFSAVAEDTVREILRSKDCSVINLFYGKNVSSEQIDSFSDTLEDAFDDIEFCAIPTADPIFDLVISFE